MLLFLLLVAMTGSANAAVGNTSGRHVTSSLPFATCHVRPLDQLKYLAKVIGFEVQVTNIPKVCLSGVHSLLLHSSVNIRHSLAGF